MFSGEIPRDKGVSPVSSHSISDFGSEVFSVRTFAVATA